MLDAEICYQSLDVLYVDPNQLESIVLLLETGHRRLSAIIASASLALLPAMDDANFNSAAEILRNETYINQARQSRKAREQLVRQLVGVPFLFFEPA